MTEYLVLFGGDGGWKSKGVYEAPSSESAIYRYVKEFGDEAAEGEYVAPPWRSWNPLEVGKETETKITIKPAKFEEKVHEAK